jgi:hypothetical protein
MAGLVPAIHVFSCRDTGKTWMPGTTPGMTVDIPLQHTSPLS